MLLLGLRRPLLSLTNKPGQAEGLLTEFVEIVRAGSTKPYEDLARNLFDQERARVTSKARDGRYLRTQLDEGKVSRAYHNDAEGLAVYAGKADPFLRKVIRDAIESLPPKQRQCAKLLAKDLSTEEIQASLGVSKEAAWKLISRTRKALDDLRAELE